MEALRDFALLDRPILNAMAWDCLYLVHTHSVASYRCYTGLKISQTALCGYSATISERRMQTWCQFRFLAVLTSCMSRVNGDKPG